MESNQNKNITKSTCKFYCNLCYYGTSKKGNYNNHIMTTKHHKILYLNYLQTKQRQNITE